MRAHVTQAVDFRKSVANSDRLNFTGGGTMDLTFTQQLQQFVSHHPVMVMAWVGIFCAVLMNFYKGATSKYRVINNAIATQLVNNSDGVVVDLRSDDEFKAGHLVGSIHLLPSEIKANNVHQIDKYKDRPVILLDANGFSATKSAELLTKQGFNQVYVLKEGMVGWKAENLPTVKKK